MNIDDTGRGPDPVVLRKNVSVLVGAFYRGIVFDIYIPLNTGEIHPVKFSVLWCAPFFLILVESGKRNDNFNAPAFVFCGRIIDRTIYMNCGTKAVHIVAVQTAAAVTVWFGKKQIPYGVQNVDFKFIVMIGIGIRVDKNFKIIVEKDYGVALGQMTPDFVSVKKGSNVQVFIIPEHFCTGDETGKRHVSALDIKKFVGVRRIFPEWFVDVSV